MTVAGRVTGVTGNERLLLLRLLAWDWHRKGCGWLVLIVAGRHVDVEDLVMSG